MAKRNGFSESETARMLALKGVGQTVISRLEQIGFSSLSQLSDQEAPIVTKQISEMMGSTCWHNSPQAKGAIQAIIDIANAE